MTQLLQNYRPSLLGQHKIKVVQTNVALYSNYRRYSPYSLMLSSLLSTESSLEVNSFPSSLHIVAQETINLNVTGERRIQVCT